MPRDPLELFLHEKVAAESAPDTADRAPTGTATNADPASIDPGERAMAGLAAIGSSVAAKVIPWVATEALADLSEAGSVPAYSPHPPRAKLMGLFPVTGLPHRLDPAKAGAYQAKLHEVFPVVESFMQHHKLYDKGVSVELRTSPLGRFSGPTYNVATKTVSLPRISKEIALHELGHAADYTKGRLGRFRAIAEPVLSRGVLTALPVAMIAGDRIKEMLPGTVDDKVIEFMQNNAPEIMGATLAATTLYPEAKASALALRHIAKNEGGAAARAAAKKLAPAFGTYLLGVIPAVVGMALARKYMREARQEKEGAHSLALDQIRELEKTSGLMRDALAWSKEFGRNIAHVGKQIGGQTAELMKDKGALTRIGRAAKEVGTSPEFVFGSVSSAIPATLGALYMYGTTAGKEIRQRISPEDREYYHTGEDRGVLFARRKDEEWRERHPLRYAGLVAAGAALSGGILTKFFTDLMKVV